MPSSYRHANSAHGCSVCVAHSSPLQGRALFPSHVGEIVKCECATHKTKNLCLSTCFSFFVHVKCKLSFSRSYTMEDEGYVFVYTQTISRFFFPHMVDGLPAINRETSQNEISCLSKKKLPHTLVDISTQSAAFTSHIVRAQATQQLEQSSNHRRKKWAAWWLPVWCNTTNLPSSYTREIGCGIPRIFSHVLQFLFFFQLLLLLTNN